MILFARLSSTFLQYETDNTTAYNNFYYNNVEWFLFVGASVTAFNVLFLRSESFRKGITGLLGYETFEKEDALRVINRLRLIEESMIGATTSWSSYCSLLEMPSAIIDYGMVPILLYAFSNGWMSDDSLYTKAVLNIANHTRIKMMLNGLKYSLTIGSFYSLGSRSLVSDIIFSGNIDDVRGFDLYSSDLSKIQYSVCVIALASHFARYPHAPIWIQRSGRYISNFGNGTANALLDQFATYQIISMIFILTIGENYSIDETAITALVFGLQATCFLYCFLTSIPATPDYPEYSIEPNSLEKTLFEMCHEKMGQIKRCFTPINQQVPEHESTDIEIINRRPSGYVSHSLFSETLRRKNKGLSEEIKTDVDCNPIQTSSL